MKIHYAFQLVLLLATFGEHNYISTVILRFSLIHNSLYCFYSLGFTQHKYHNMSSIPLKYASRSLLRGRTYSNPHFTRAYVPFLSITPFSFMTPLILISDIA